jgi:hypothetical protein
VSPPPSTPPPQPPPTTTPTMPTLNRKPSLTVTIAQPNSSNSSSSSSSHQISPTSPSAQCLSSPRLRSTRIRIRIDCPLGSRVERISCLELKPRGQKTLLSGSMRRSGS